MLHKNISTVKDFVRIWFYWKNWAILAAIVPIVFIMGFAYICQPLYESSAKIVVLPQTSESAIISAAKENYAIVPVSTQDITTEIEIMTSDDVYKKTVQSFLDEGAKMKLHRDEKNMLKTITAPVLSSINTLLLSLKLVETISPFDASVHLLASSLTIEPIAGSNIISLKLRAESPHLAANVLKRFLHIYMSHHNQVFIRKDGFDFYANQTKSYLEQLDTTENELNTFKQQHDIINVDLQNEKMVSRITELEQQLQQLDVAYDEAQSRIELLHTALESSNDDIILLPDMHMSSILQNIEQEIASLHIQKNEILKKYTLQSREYKDIIKHIALLKKERKNEIERTLKSEMLELTTLETKKHSLRIHLKAEKKKLFDLNKQRIKFANLQQYADLQQRNYITYASKAYTAQMHSDQIDHNITNVSIADDADIPASIAFPNRMVLLFISLILSTIVLCITPFMLEISDHRLKNLSDIETLLELPVICAYRKS